MRRSGPVTLPLFPPDASAPSGAAPVSPVAEASPAPLARVLTFPRVAAAGIASAVPVVVRGDTDQIDKQREGIEAARVEVERCRRAFEIASEEHRERSIVLTTNKAFAERDVNARA